MTNAELVDSKRFCAFMDTFVSEWPKADDGKRVGMLDQAVNWFTGAPAETRSITEVVTLAPEPIQPKKRGRPPKAKPETEPQDIKAAKAALLAEMRRPLTAKEKAEALALAKTEAAKVRDPQLIVNDAVGQVIKPNWATTPMTEGFRHFLVKADRNGERVSFEPEKWLAALRLHQIPVSNISFKPEGLAMDPGAMNTTIGGAMWRVIIG